MPSFWETFENRRKLLDISRAEMARRAGISESTITKGLKRQAKPQGSIRRNVLAVIEAEEKAREDAA